MSSQNDTTLLGAENNTFSIQPTKVPDPSWNFHDMILKRELTIDSWAFLTGIVFVVFSYIAITIFVCKARNAILRNENLPVKNLNFCWEKKKPKGMKKFNNQETQMDEISSASVDNQNELKPAKRKKHIRNVAYTLESE